MGDGVSAGLTHADLVSLGARWLRRRCVVVAAELRCMYASEQPDVIGWSGMGRCFVIECKASRSDFLRDAKKFHKRFGYSINAERWYLAARGVIRPDDIDHGVGLLEVNTDRSMSITVKAKAPPRDISAANEAIYLARIARNALRGIKQPVFAKAVKL